MTDRPTPMTDAEEARMRDAGCPGIVTAGFCQRIERELAEALEQRDELMEALEDIAFGALIRRASGGCGQRQLSSAAQMSRRAESAIAAVKGGT
jgi:hypothetical protein